MRSLLVVEIGGFLVELRRRRSPGPVNGFGSSPCWRRAVARIGCSGDRAGRGWSLAQRQRYATRRGARACVFVRDTAGFGAELSRSPVRDPSGQVRSARIGDGRIGEHVDDRRQTAGEGPLQRRAKFARARTPARRARPARAPPRRSGCPDAAPPPPNSRRALPSGAFPGPRCRCCRSPIRPARCAGPGCPIPCR